MTTSVELPAVPDQDAARRMVRQGYWARWSISLMALLCCGQAIIALGVSLVWAPLMPFGLADAFGALLVACISLLAGPGVLHPPTENRLRLEEWAGAEQAPPEA